MAKIDEEDRLIQRARRGDPSAFAEVATRWWSPIYRIAWNMLGTESEAAEVARRTLLSLRLPGPLPCGEPFRISLYRIAFDMIWVRRRAWTGSVESHAPRFDEPGPQISPGEDWSELADAFSQRPGAATRVREMLGRLESMDRAAFVLREIEGLPVEEVALILRTSPAETRAHVHRAVLWMSGLLQRMLSLQAGSSLADPRCRSL